MFLGGLGLRGFLCKGFRDSGVNGVQGFRVDRCSGLRVSGVWSLGFFEPMSMSFAKLLGICQTTGPF